MRSCLSAFALVGAIAVSGCYSTAPQYWAERSRREVVEAKELLPDGDRAQIEVAPYGSELRTKVSLAPLCRESERGHEVINESGQREEHYWPIPVLGLVATGAGAAAFAVGGDQDWAVITGTSGLSLGITLLLMTFYAMGKDDGGRTEYRDREGDPFQRWTESPKERRFCPKSPTKPVAGFPLDIRARFARTSRELIWRGQTDAQGMHSLPIGDLVRMVAAHCGEATVTVAEGDSAVRAPNRAWTQPASTTLSALPAQDPATLGVAAAREVALSCAKASFDQCVGSRANEIRRDCEVECASEAGAEACEFQLNTCLSLPGLSADDKDLCRARHRACAQGRGVDDAKTATCRANCFGRRGSAFCPPGW